VKKILLFMVLCVALLASCASPRKAMVEPYITEAKVLQTLVKERGAEVYATGDLVTKAEKQKENGDWEGAFLLADEAILLLQIALVEKEKKNIEDSLARTNDILNANRNLLSERKGK